MMRDLLSRFYEHNNWANHALLELCQGLSGEQLDAAPRSATRGSIRETVLHLARAQQGYLDLLTVPLESRSRAGVAFDELVQAVDASGGALLALVRAPEVGQLPARLQTRDGYLVEPWVVLLQALNHAGEHREQISSMLTELGITPPALDGWTFGESQASLLPVQPDAG